MKTLLELNKLWGQLGNVPVNDNDELDADFLHFPKGTHREEVWHWFEDQNPEFSVGDIMTGKVINNKQLLQEVRDWLQDYEELTGEAYGDEDTLEGSAYILLSRMANLLK